MIFLLISVSINNHIQSLLYSNIIVAIWCGAVNMVTWNYVSVVNYLEILLKNILRSASNVLHCGVRWE